VQCDIDIIGDASVRAEAELIVATLDAVDALGLAGASVRVNDRRALDGILAAFGFAEAERPGVLITIDKLDKIGPDGVVAELRERGASSDAVAAFEAFLSRPAAEGAGLDADVVRAALPDAVDPAVVDHLAALGAAVAAARGGAVPLVFDPFLVRGMGYYTGTIFELAHPSVSYSLGGGGRYDGMIGRFLGQDVPAVGFSIGFERIVDLVATEADGAADAVVLVHDRDIPPAELVALKAALVAGGRRVRLEARTKNLKALLDRAAADGYTAFAAVSPGTAADALELRPLG
jgi:histidyl-tRNA synthetase